MEEYIPALGILDLARHKTSKKGCIRQIRLGAEMLQLVESLKARWKTGRLFRSRDGGVITASRLGDRLRRLVAKAGIPPEEGKFIIPYSYRHSFCVRALQAAVPVSKVAKLLGHRSTKMIETVYGHILDDVTKEGPVADLLEK